MIKTFTNQFSSQLSDNSFVEHAAETERKNERFYEHIKPMLTKLRREPSNECVNKILAYAKQKL